MLKSEIKWTNKSVVGLSGGDDPINELIRMVRKIILESSDRGIKGPPYDPFEIANYMGIKVLPRHDISDARTVPLQNDKFLIEYNPNKPRGRIRFSLAHELSHTLFPDCADDIRNRENLQGNRSDKWQIELLCNLGASEFLMPIGSFPSLAVEELSIGNLMNLRSRYDVSSEALFLRAVKLTKAPCFVFCATRINPNEQESEYGIDYLVCSKSWGIELPRKLILPSNTIVKKCTAVGYKLIFDEIWDHNIGEFHIECVGIPPFSSHRYPRVLGIVTKSQTKKEKINGITYKYGDATQPHVEDPFIIAHVVNDKAQSWGGRGFTKSLRERWPTAYTDYGKWRKKNPMEAGLGYIHKFIVNDDAMIISMVAQKGYGPSDSPRIRYNALKGCLRKVATEALSNSATVHMPRIGSGQAGGSWNIISELIDEELCDKAVKVYIYDLPFKDNMGLFD